MRAGTSHAPQASVPLLSRIGPFRVEHRPHLSALIGVHPRHALSACIREDPHAQPVATQIDADRSQARMNADCGSRSSSSWNSRRVLHRRVRFRCCRSTGRQTRKQVMCDVPLFPEGGDDVDGGVDSQMSLAPADPGGRVVRAHQNRQTQGEAVTCRLQRLARPRIENRKGPIWGIHSHTFAGY
jgi:hypothetical protein